MQVPFFDIGRLNAELESELLAAAARTLGSGWYILGTEVQTFEQAMAESLGTSVMVAACNSGTDALVLALLAAGIGPGHEVITVANTAIPTVAAICATGATPVFVDVDPDTWLLDATRITAALTPATKAVIAVHLYGAMADCAAIQTVLCAAGRPDVALIEDVAQAQGAELGGRRAGTLGRFGAFSFYPSKNIGALGDGGAVCAGDRHDGAVLKELRNYGQRDRYHASTPRGINSRLDEIQAALLLTKLPHLAEWNRRKAALMETYRRSLAHLPLTFQAVTDGCRPAWHLCVVACSDTATRDALQQHLQAAGVQTIIHYPIPCHLQPAFGRARSTGLPVTESLAGRILSLPFSPVLTESEQAYVIQQVAGYFSRSSSHCAL
ncbi:DegT/DnrJ/EryC1/StrS family aminotransferase [Trichlorobacter ammonificans]|uniref:dTDP-3-amino-3,4,6-trideoxy-alpha-D-glucose transaminase n=1 Tax=Trichlorobacter ammonificans TaxID=2916410 RepID=A0ABM9D5G9_9BACT|nr:DegT/DnrJ/EryC1/StrS family aminotransferase [Trichlorobacter ammonificans]CAH2030480.1 dTDP-3-amino-3,4,6-trideoxy-alpha-D-glucose transaminase [Trichlorobacter ammonificans]